MHDFQTTLQSTVKAARDDRRHKVTSFMVGASLVLSMALAFGHFSGLFVLGSLWMIGAPVLIGVGGLYAIRLIPFAISVVIVATVAISLFALMVLGLLSMLVATGVGKVIPAFRSAMDGFVNFVDETVTNIIDGADSLIKSASAKLSNA